MATNQNVHEENDYGFDDLYEEDEELEDYSDNPESPTVANFLRKKKPKQGRKGQWDDDLVNDLVDIIIENEKLKEKLLMTNVRNKKNSQYYEEVIKEITERCKERGKDFNYTVTQTRNKFKRCITTCRNALMTIKTASGIKRFQEDKSLGNWFGRLVPVISSMDNCQPSQSIEPSSRGLSAPEKDGDDSDDGDEGERSGSPSNENGSDLSSGTPLNSRKRKSFVPTPSVKKRSLKTETVLEEIKGTVQSLKEMSEDNSSKDILAFLKQESERQSERDNKFFELMSKFLTPQPQPQPPSQLNLYQGIPTPQQHHHHSQLPHSASSSSFFQNTSGTGSEHGFRFGMTNIRPTSRTHSQTSYMAQLMDPDYSLTEKENL